MFISTITSAPITWLSNTVAFVRTYGLQLLSARSGKSSSEEWRNGLQTVTAELQKLNRSTEADFLVVGEKLLTFMSAARKLHSDLQGLSALTSGEQTRGAFDILVSVRGYAQEIRSRSAQTSMALAALQGAAAHIRSEFSTLTNIVLSFRITAIIARIETAHLHISQKNFVNLAEEMGTCADGIQSKADHVIASVTAFESGITAALSKIAEMDAVQQTKLPALLAAVNRDIEKLDAQQEQTADTSAQLASTLNAVKTELGEIATSIQSHDITRQRIEHVVTALDGLPVDSAHKKLDASGAALVRLQKAQLAGAASAIVESTQTINRDLHRITTRVSEMSVASKNILGSNQDSDDSFLTQMQEQFISIGQAISESLSLELTAQEIIRELVTLSRALCSSVEEVQAIEQKLSLIAINAAVSACHLGPAGEPLNVVAGATKRLQIDCSSRSRAAESELNSITANTEVLASTSNDSTGGELVLKDLRASMNGLRTAGESGARTAAAVVTAAETLCRDLEATRNRFGTPQVFEFAVSRCCDVLESIANEAETNSESGEIVAKPQLEQLYTMQAEREIHLKANGTAVDTDSGVVDSGGEAEFF